MSKVYESLLDEDDIESLVETFPTIRYVSIATEEPLTGLALEEAEYLLSNTQFSQKTFQNKLIKYILYLHCLGYTDKEITDGLNDKILIRTKLTYEATKKKRQRALELIDRKYNKNIGLITLIYEKFKVIRENYEI